MQLTSSPSKRFVLDGYAIVNCCIWIARIPIEFCTMHPSLHAISPEAQSYLFKQQCARQWRGFLQAMAVEFSAALPSDELRDLMQRIGVKFALQNPLPTCTTLMQLQESITSQWSHIDWGWTQLTQDTSCLTIQHHCAPLISAFGAENSSWIYGFLQGAYQQWFDSAGANHLQVRQAATEDAWGSVRFELSL